MSYNPFTTAPTQTTFVPCNPRGHASTILPLPKTPAKRMKEEYTVPCGPQRNNRAMARGRRLTFAPSLDLDGHPLTPSKPAKKASRPSRAVLRQKYAATTPQLPPRSSRPALKRRYSTTSQTQLHQQELISRTLYLQPQPHDRRESQSQFPPHYQHQGSSQLVSRAFPYDCHPSQRAEGLTMMSPKDFVSMIAQDERRAYPHASSTFSSQ